MLDLRALLRLGARDKEQHMILDLPTYEVLDDRFYAVRGDATLTTHYAGCRWAEGPAYFPAHRSVVWSDIPNDRLLRLDELSGTVSVFRTPAGHPNGNTTDAQGRLITCEHSNRRVTRTEHDGSVTVLADRAGPNQRFNSPNDVAVAADGSVWFTDASYGIDSDYEGCRAPSELDACYLFRVDPETGEARIMADGFQRPTGISFSPDGSLLYVADSRANTIRRFRVSHDNSLEGGEVLVSGTAPSLDSMRTDVEGRIWIACSDGVRCYDPDGTHLGTIRTPDAAANIVFGGPRRNVLYICATTRLQSLMLATSGAAHA
jgi:gluconolactonase